MDILEALNQSKNVCKEQRINMPDGLLSVSDGVFYATLYRLGREDHKDCPLSERGELLEILENDKR